MPCNPSTFYFNTSDFLRFEMHLQQGLPDCNAPIFNEVIRNREERKQLKATTCSKCSSFFQKVFRFYPTTQLESDLGTTWARRSRSPGASVMRVLYTAHDRAVCLGYLIGSEFPARNRVLQSWFQTDVLHSAGGGRTIRNIRTAAVFRHLSV
jgi:hypothetical protein